MPLREMLGSTYVENIGPVAALPLCFRFLPAWISAPARQIAAPTAAGAKTARLRADAINIASPGGANETPRSLTTLPIFAWLYFFCVSSIRFLARSSRGYENR